jgi:outer membrane protein OmpA-like peptidoglycan-associated protein
MPSLKPMLGDFELQQVQRIETEGDQLLVAHRVPGLEGDFLQGLGRRGGRIALTGVATGPESRERLKTVREKFLAAEPVSFVSDIATATQVDQVVIEELEVRELAGKPERSEYALVLREYTPPPPEESEEPPPVPVPPEPVEETGTLVVEVTVEGEPGFDFSKVTVTAEGRREDGTSLSLPLTDRTNNFWTREEMPPGQYTVRAVVTDPPEMAGSGEAAVRSGQTTPVTLTLRRGAVIAKVFIVHFWFDNAFVEPCMKEVLARAAEYAEDHPDEKLVIVGHCDKTGSAVYNQSLSERRARAVYACVSFGRSPVTADAEWNELRRSPPPSGVRDSWGTREAQFMLQDQRFYAGNVDGQHGPLTSDGVRRFQAAHDLPATGSVDEGTWRALIAAYLSDGLPTLPESRFLPNCEGEILKWLGCGEEDPVRNTEDAWRPNRRVELLFVRADRLPTPVRRPDTFALPAPGAVNADWCVGDGASPRCGFLARTPGAGAGAWPVEPAEPGTVLVQGSITFEDGTPAAGIRYVLIAPDGENMDGEVASGPERGKPVLGRTAEDGTFAYPDKPKGVGHYVLEVREPLVARSAGDPPSEARGNVVCRHLDGSEPFRVLVMPLPTSLEIVDAADVEREVELARIGDSVRVRAEIPGAVGDEITVEVTIHLLRS